jgi:hypothetical protein
MSIYPQLSNGAACQFPFEKTLLYRTIVNLVEDGSRIVLEDPNAVAVRWKLSYSGLTDTELTALQSFFESAAGRLQTFTFLDPSGNLLTWSEDFSQTAWQKSTFLQCQTGVGDPLGTQRATTVPNNGSAALALVQSISVPSSAFCCFSFFVRSNSAAVVTLSRGDASETVSVSNSWQRVFLATAASDGSATSSFSIVIPAGVAVDLFGMQVEAQTSPSTYVQTLDQSGVYPATRFDSDLFAFTADAPNSNRCQVSLYSRITL